jgi:hypothetical protein
MHPILVCHKQTTFLYSVVNMNCTEQESKWYNWCWYIWCDQEDWDSVHLAIRIIGGDNNSESVNRLMWRLFILWYETKKHEEQFFWMYDDYPKSIYRFILEEWIQVHED